MFHELVKPFAALKLTNTPKKSDLVFPNSKALKGTAM